MNKAKQKYPVRLDRGPKGRRLCRVCGQEVTGRRQTFCSQACVDVYLQDADWGHVCRRVYKRDAGVCAICGFDTAKLRRILDAVGEWGIRFGAPRFIHDRQASRATLMELGFTSYETFRALWQCDHIQERVRGGSNELSNLRTLCVFCHKRETARLARERAAERHDAHRPLLAKKEKASMSEWPRLSMAVWPQDMAKGGPGRQIGVCMKCGREGDDVVAWQECDDADRPEPIAIMLCRRCGDEIIDPHPRLYRVVPRFMPFPGIMACCRGCSHQGHLRCRVAKCHGGPGVHLHYPEPTHAFVDGSRNGRRWGGQMLVYHEPPTCDDRVERGPTVAACGEE